MPDSDSTNPKTVKRIVEQSVESQMAVSPWLAVSLAMILLGALGAVPSALAFGTGASGSIAGVVKDVSGTPQIGIVVELLRADSTLAARVYTDRRGNYSMAAVLPGQYSLKAMGGDFIPTLKRNLRIRANTVVDLTLSSLYDLMQFVPQSRRTHPRTDDDWAWTLRSTESRPLLRWLPDGSPIMIWDGAAETSTAETRRTSTAKRRVRVTATGGEKRFGSSGQSISAGMLKDASARRRIAMSAEVSPDSTGLMNGMLGFRQQMADSGIGSSSVQTVFALMNDPVAGAGAKQGLQAASIRTWESLQLVEGLDAEAGSEQVLARVGDGSGSGSTVFAALPFASVTLHRGESALEYRVATAPSADPEASESLAGPWLPVLSERDGELVLEHGLHQELGWSTTAGPAEMQLILYDDTVDNPMIEAAGRLSEAENTGGWMLVDGASGLLRAAGPSYSTTGVVASLTSRLPGDNRIQLSYASGDALTLRASASPEPLAAILAGAHARRAQMYSIVLSGTAESTGTHWRASYRWQPQSTVTAVAPLAVDVADPYLNLSIRQPIRVCGQGANGLEARVDVRNLLAEGYQPFLSSDGSRLYFAQAQRSVRGGLAFTF